MGEMAWIKGCFTHSFVIYICRS